MVYLINYCLLLNRILDFVEVNRVFVSQKVENVERLDCFGPILFVPENQINPLMKLCRNNIGLKRQAVNSNKILWRLNHD